MANTYTWTIDQLTCTPNQGGFQNVVIFVQFSMSGTDGTYTATIQSNVALPSPVSSDFVPYDKLTQDEVVGWVQAALGPEGIAQYEGSIDTQLAALAVPPVVIPPLPW